MVRRIHHKLVVYLWKEETKMLLNAWRKARRAIVSSPLCKYQHVYASSEAVRLQEVRAACQEPTCLDSWSF